MSLRATTILLTLPFGAALVAADQGDAAPVPARGGAAVNVQAGERELDAGVRFFVQSAPTHYEDVTYGGEDDFDSGVRIGVMGVFRGGAKKPGDVGFFGGIGLGYTAYSQVIGPADFTLTEFGMDLQLGAYMPVAPMFEIEIGMDLGFGTANAELSSGSSSVTSDSGSYVLFDIFIRPSLMTREGFNAYLTLGYQTQTATLSYATNDQDLRMSGGYFGAGLGFFF
jgi:hypothetical protein